MTNQKQDSDLAGPARVFKKSRAKSSSLHDLKSTGERFWFSTSLKLAAVASQRTSARLKGSVHQIHPSLKFNTLGWLKCEVDYKNTPKKILCIFENFKRCQRSRKDPPFWKKWKNWKLSKISFLFLKIA